MMETEDPKLRLQYLKETGQQEEAKLYEQYLRETGQWQETKVPAPEFAGVRPDATAALSRERGNPTGDLQALHGAAGAVPAIAGLATSHILNAAQGFPGMRQLEAAAGAVGSHATDHPMTYAESKAALDQMTDEIPGDLRTVGQFAGGSALEGPLLIAGAQKVKRYAPVVKAVAKEAVPARIQKMIRAGRRVTKALPETKVTPLSVKGKATIADDVAETLESRLGLTPEKMGLIEEGTPTLENRLGDVVRNESPFKQRGATKARFEYFADRMAKRAAAQAAAGAGEAAEPSLEDLLALSLEHIKKGGTLQQAGEVAAKMRAR